MIPIMIPIKLIPIRIITTNPTSNMHHLNINQLSKKYFNFYYGKLESQDYKHMDLNFQTGKIYHLGLKIDFFSVDTRHNDGSV